MTSPAATQQRHVEQCMGTVFSLDVRAPGVDAAAIAEVVAWLHHVDAVFSTYRADSEISRLARGELTRAGCSAEVRGVLAECERLEDVTDGYFSARIGGRLDPSGYVKGWAIERAGDLLEAAGSRNHCVNGGGDVQCVGNPEPGRQWSVGIVDPHRRDQLAATVEGTRLAVATSGTAERGAHILDPHTRRPPVGLASVTVVGSRLGEVDAYATAAFAMGAQAPSWLGTLDGIRALVVFADGARWTCPAP